MYQTTHRYFITRPAISVEIREYINSFLITCIKCRMFAAVSFYELIVSESSIFYSIDWQHRIEPVPPGLVRPGALRCSSLSQHWESPNALDNLYARILIPASTNDHYLRLGYTKTHSQVRQTNSSLPIPWKNALVNNRGCYQEVIARSGKILGA